MYFQDESDDIRDRLRKEMQNALIRVERIEGVFLFLNRIFPVAQINEVVPF